MIFYNIYATIRSGQGANLTAGIKKVFDFAERNQPDYAAFANIDAEKRKVVFFNVFSDAAAMRTHYALIPELPGFQQIVASMDVTRREIFGALPSDLEAQVAGPDLTYRPMTLGMINRQIASTSHAGDF